MTYEYQNDVTGSLLAAGLKVKTFVPGSSPVTSSPSATTDASGRPLPAPPAGAYWTVNVKLGLTVLVYNSPSSSAPSVPNPPNTAWTLIGGSFWAALPGNLGAAKAFGLFDVDLLVPPSWANLGSNAGVAAHDAENAKAAAANTATAHSNAAASGLAKAVAAATGPVAKWQSAMAAADAAATAIETAVSAWLAGADPMPWTQQTATSGYYSEGANDVALGQALTQGQSALTAAQAAAQLAFNALVPVIKAYSAVGWFPELTPGMTPPAIAAAQNLLDSLDNSPGTNELLNAANPSGVNLKLGDLYPSFLATQLKIGANAYTGPAAVAAANAEQHNGAGAAGAGGCSSGPSMMVILLIVGVAYLLLGRKKEA